MGVTINIEQPKRMIKEVEDFFNQTDWMAHIVEDIREKILANTSSGKDYMSKNFEKYSDTYATKKGQKKVDLKVTETMIKAITAKVITALTGMVHIKPNIGPEGRNRNVIAGFHNFGDGRNPVREFMNIPESFKDKLVKKYIDDEILKITRKYR